MSDKLVNHFVLADGSVAKYDYDGLLNVPDFESLVKIVNENHSYTYDLVWTTGKYIVESNGNIGTASSMACTVVYYPVLAGQKLYIHVDANGENECGVAFYNSEKTFHSAVKAGHIGAIVTVPIDGFARFSTKNSSQYIPVDDAYVQSVASPDIDKKLADGVSFDYDLVWKTGYFINNSTGDRSSTSTMAMTINLCPVYKDQKLYLHLKDNGGNECSVAFYDEALSYIGYANSDGTSIATVPADGYAIFSTRIATIPTADAYVKNYIEQAAKASELTKPYFPSSFNDFVAKEATVDFSPSTLPLDYKYKGQVNPEKRYMAIGFDDFRDSDFDMVIPLFDKYGAKAVFNRVARTPVMSDGDKNKINNVIYGGHELGDHTWLHYNYPYTLPLFNGQNPASPEGTQEPYPTNAQMTADRGDGKNALGLALTAAANIGGVSTAWGSLTAAECQTIREYYAVIKDTAFCNILDTLSNKYLGTTGSSAGSWDDTTGKYTGGIFAGCATSCNHEIWERILMVTRMYYKDQFGLNYTFNTWSWPGSKGDNISFEQDGLRYYDAEHTKLINYLARFESSLYTDELGNPKNRSWNDILAEFGYTDTHDSVYPNRYDGQTAPQMFWQYIYNADVSRPNAIIYPTNRVVSYSAISNAYPESFFTSGKTKASQMYDAGTNSEFHQFIENWRQRMSQGIIGGEVIDSVDNYSERVFLEEVLRYCKETGVEVITKAQAYDICFNHRVSNGNLMYNPRLRNTAKEFLKDATTVPNNPDGYSINCTTYKDENGVNVLHTTATAYHNHYGIAPGKYKFTVESKTNGGSKSITIKAIKNSDNFSLSNSDIDNLDTLETISIAYTTTDFTEFSAEFTVKENDLTAYEQKCAGYGDKIMGIMFVFTGGMAVKNMRLEAI